MKNIFKKIIVFFKDEEWEKKQLCMKTKLNELYAILKQKKDILDSYMLEKTLDSIDYKVIDNMQLEINNINNHIDLLEDKLGYHTFGG